MVTKEDLLKNMIEFWVELITSQHLLIVRDGNEQIIKQYPIAVGRYNDDKQSLWAADYRTPKGAYLVTAIYKKGSEGLEIANEKYYPWYLAHKYRDSFEDAGTGVYGDGIIVLNYPNKKDIENFRRAELDGKLKIEWKKFCNSHWKLIYKHQANIEGKPLEKIVIDGDFGKKTFEQLYKHVPHEEAFNIPLSIHGTNDPECVGHDISAGCIRMNNEHIVELIQNYTVVGTPILIN